ncbi:hypothetical protein M422DRAFT_174674, partial [Sphaerobolus stellatus SS14]
FINPWLYSKGFKGLNDIFIGQSEGCDGKGFYSSSGWDPVTGMSCLVLVRCIKLRMSSNRTWNPGFSQLSTTFVTLSRLCEILFKLALISKRYSTCIGSAHSRILHSPTLNDDVQCFIGIFYQC